MGLKDTRIKTLKIGWFISSVSVVYLLPSCNFWYVFSSSLAMLRNSFVFKANKSKYRRKVSLISLSCCPYTVLSPVPMFVWKDIPVKFIDCILEVWVFKGDNQDVQLF